MMAGVVPQTSLVYRTIDSPIGPLLLAGDADALRVLAFVCDRHPVPDATWVRDERGVLDPVRRELDEYFAGRLVRFRTAVAPDGTSFQRSVWQELQAIPYGQTISYSDLARRIDRPKAVRAVGAANGANPIAIIIPCHRVIGANGSLTGFGGGLPPARATRPRTRHAATVVGCFGPFVCPSCLRGFVSPATRL
jgi:methylated-DNA-[protein]-cysteine S-methyltransferase